MSSSTPPSSSSQPPSDPSTPNPPPLSLGVPLEATLLAPAAAPPTTSCLVGRASTTTAAGATHQEPPAPAATIVDLRRCCLVTCRRKIALPDRDMAQCRHCSRVHCMNHRLPGVTHDCLDFRTMHKLETFTAVAVKDRTDTKRSKLGLGDL